MKVQKKIVIMGIISCSILLGLFINSCSAVNETGNATKSQNNSSANTQKQNTTNTNKTTGKSNNANLDMLGIRPHDFSGFRYGTTSYEVEVPESTESVEVYAEVQDAKATLTGTGKKTLQKGENKVQVVVTAENGNKRTYTITIIRGGNKEEETAKQDKEETTKPEQEPTKQEDKKSDGLQELKIENLELSPKFETNVYEYHVKYIGEATKLNLETKPTSANYVVEVTGNEDLQEGENVITILVSDKSGDNIATYQITVDKSLVDEEAIAKQKEAEEREKQQKIIIGMIIVAVVIVAVVIIVKTKRKRKEKIEDDFFANPYYEDYDDYEEEKRTPKAFHHNYEENNRTETRSYDDFGSMEKDKAKEQFLNGYTSQYDIDFGGGYQEEKSRGKHKGKRFK